MKNILSKININITTYLFLFSCFFTGYIKQALIIFLIVIVHELGHVLVAKILGYNTNKIDILPFGGVSSINKPINTPLEKEFMIALGGITFQMFLYLVVFGLYSISLIDDAFWRIFIKYNFLILFFNLLWIYPLDGFKLISCLVEKFFSYYYSYSFLGIISIIFLFVFLSFNKIFSLNNYLVISFLLYKCFEYYKNKTKLYYRFLLERYLHKLKYKKIIYENQINLKKLKKDCKHYFLIHDKIIKEDDLVAKKFDISKRF